MEASFSRRLTAIFACVLLVFSAAALFGQGIVTGSINGTVEDQQHAVVPGATVTAVSTATNIKYTATTNNTGYFSLASLPVGVYNLTVEAPKFSKLAINSVQVNSNTATSLGARALSVGTETVVTVADTAPLVQADPVNITGSFDTKKAADLPIGNGFDSLALLTPGISETGSIGGALANSNGAGISANGQRGRSNNFEIDGQANNDNSISGPSLFFGNQDAIQEVQVLTNYDAQYGRNMGDVINYVTKAGTNAFHGTAFEIYNGNWGDAMANQDKNPLLGFCNPGQDPGPNDANCTPPVVPRYVDNRFGGTLGGPIWRDKLWFFGSGNFERQRIGASPNSSGSSLTPDETGLSQLNAAFPNNAAVAALEAIGPTAVKVGGNVTFANPTTLLVSATPGVSCTATPAACVPVEFAQANRTLSSIFNDYEGSGRIDYQISPKDRFFGRYLFQQTLNTNLGFNGAVGDAQGDFVDLPARDQQIGLDYVRNFTNNFLNQLRFSYSRARFFFEGGSFPNCLAADIHNCPTNVSIGATDGTPLLGIGIATNEPQGRIINVYQYQDNATWVRGRHTFKFGGEYDRQRSPNVFLPLTNGSFAFPNFNAFLANTPSTTRLTDGLATQGFKENDLAFYGQDDWRIKDNLTLTLGLRWEWNQQAINLLHDEDVARESNPATAFWDPSLPLSLRTVPHIPQDLNNFAPVVGFAYTPRFGKAIFGDDKTVIRGGFRIAYDPEFYNIFGNVATSTPSVNAALLTSCPGCLPASGSATDVRSNLLPQLPRGTNPGCVQLTVGAPCSNVRSWTTVAPNFHSPYTEQWNLGVQREITHNVVGEVRYVGNHDVGLFQDVNANPALNALINAGFQSVIPPGLTPCATPNAPGSFRNRGYVDCTKTNVLQRANAGFSSYQGLQTNLRISNWHGATAGVAYTWSHTIDTSSDVFSLLSGGSTLTFPQNPFNFTAGERGNSGEDFPNVTSIYVIYDTPWFKSQKGVFGHLLGGWEINPVYRFASGQPYTAVETRFIGAGSTICDPTATFSGTFSACRPFISNPSAPIDSVGQCINTACSLVDFTSGANTTPGAVHFIVNDANSETFFGTPFGTSARNTLRGDTTNQVNLSLFKNMKVNERLTVQLRGVAYNALNRMFRGVPDPLIDDTSFDAVNNPLGSFGNTHLNSSGGDSTNVVFNGIGRRRIEVGAKLIF